MPVLRRRGWFEAEGESLMPALSCSVGGWFGAEGATSVAPQGKVSPTTEVGATEASCGWIGAVQCSSHTGGGKAVAMQLCRTG